MSAPTANGTVGTGTAALSRGQLRKLKAKKKAQSEKDEPTVTVTPVPEERPAELIVEIKPEVEDQVVIDQAFADVFAKFQIPQEDEVEDSKPGVDGKGEIIYSDDEMPSEEDEQVQVELSKRKQRKLNRLSVAELKRLVKKPEVVDWVDVSATDPKLLVQMKSHRNTIPVPQHWQQKRDYLQGKRGIEKPPFELPSFIADTGIATQRDAIKEKEEGQSLKSKTRERVQPKMGKIDIDYQKLHDAFFKYQTKPKMSDFGELYYEGKEFETKLKEKKPGDLSEDLKEALSIPPLAPPPWLIGMQRFGPPPSYPNLRIAGLNAPIPEGAAWGFHPGGWGKPPLDEFGRPLYGDIYGAQQGQGEDALGEPVVREPWGELEPDEEESSDDEEEEDEDEDDEPAPADGLQTPSGLETPSGLASVTSTVPGGLETPDFLELRKRREATAADDGPRSLYQVIPERQGAGVRGLIGSDRVYDVSAVAPVAGGQGLPVLGRELQEAAKEKKRKAGGVEIALDAGELEGLSEEELRERYERAGRVGRGTHEDLSDVVGEEQAKRRKTAEAKGKRGAQEKEKFKF